MSTPVVMPQLGESVVEGVVVKWRVAQGDHVKRDQPLCEVETDKATSEVPSPEDGVVTRLLVKEGETVGVGKPILELDSAPVDVGMADTFAASPQIHSPMQGRGQGEGSPVTVVARAARAPTSGGSDDARISPVVRKMAAEHDVELSQLRGTGDGGRVTKKDLQAYLDQRAATPLSPAGGRDRVRGPVTPVVAPAAPPPAPVPSGVDRLVPFTRRRKLIAERMSQSRHLIPEVTCVAEVDVSRIAALRARYKAQTPPVKLTYLPFIAAAAVRALREFPVVNAQVSDEATLFKGEINLGLAVETDEGLIVPVIRRADALSLTGLGRAIDAFGEKARAGKLTADDVSGGTFTVSNPGIKGNLWGTPIINHPQAGILRMGEVVKRPVVVERDGEDSIVIRPMMYLAFAYDHRIIDGVVGNAYLYRVRELLEAADFPL
jgi:2-oxoglutarate dehydrogenase E2 component (dihydrolipoamide succinyltransferase)